MTVYWCDPYFNSTNGRLHGYTGAGDLGTYTNPFEMDGDCTNISGITSGDEIRIKGLAEASFFGTQQGLTAHVRSGGSGAEYDYYIATTGTISTNNLIKFRTDQTQKEVYWWSYGAQCYTTKDLQFYYQGLGCYLDTTYGYYEFDSDYKITSALTLQTSASATVAGVKITAGWTSETVKDGVSILHVTGTCHFGRSDLIKSTTGYGLEIDATELTLAPTSVGSLYINDLTIGKTIACGAFTQFRAFISEVGHIQQYYGGYYENWNLENYQSLGPASVNLTIDHYVVPYQAQVNSFHTNKDTSVSRWKLFFTEFYGPGSSGSNLVVQSGHTLDVEWKTNWLRAGKSAVTYGLTTGTVGTYTVNSTTRTFEMGWSGSGCRDEVFSGPNLSSAYNTSVPSPNSSVSTLYIGSSPFDIAVASGQFGPSIFVKALNNTATLDDLDAKIMTSTLSTVYSSPSKLTILADGYAEEPCQLMWSSNVSTVGFPVVINRSPNFSDKLTWHFSSHTDDGVYAESFAIDMPTIAELDFDCAFTTSSTPGVTIKAQLYTANSSGVTTGYGLQTASVVGTAATITQTIAAATFTSNDAQSAYAIVEMTKTSGAVANVSINTLGLS